jgi:hypothetical protein
MSPQAGFVLQQEIVPRFKSAIPKTASMIGAEDPEELVQDSIAMAAKLIHARAGRVPPESRRRMT